MKFFHLSDLHIGLKLSGRDFMEDQEYILKQIVERAKEEEPDGVVIAGDIYDKAVPSAEAATVFDHFISELTQAVPKTVVMMISGNHDSAPRVNVFRSILSKQNIHMVGMPPVNPGEFMEKVTLQDSFGEVNFYLLPFVRPSMARMLFGTDDCGGGLSYDETIHRLLQREEIDTAQRNVFVSHQFYVPVGTSSESVERMDSEIRTVGNIDEVKADVLEKFDYAALGHIHKPMKVGSDVYRYCGTPLACSVSEAGQKKGIIVVEMGEKGRVDTRVIPLNPLRQVLSFKGTLKEALGLGCSDYVAVTLTDKADLDVIDMQERIRSAFPNLLELHRETYKKADYTRAYTREENLDPFELCSRFLTDLEDYEQELLRDVIHTVWEVQ